MESHEVKLRVSIETTGAIPEPGAPAVPTPTPALPGAPPPDGGPATPAPAPGMPVPGAPAPGATPAPSAPPNAPTAPGTAPVVPDETRREIEDSVLRRIGERGLGLGRSALGGDLSREIEQLGGAVAGQIPFGAVAFRGALLAEKYGAPALEAIGLPGAPMAESLARTIGAGRAALDAGGATISDVTDAAAAQFMLAGRTDAAGLAEIARVRYAVSRTVAEAERNRALHARELAWVAGGDAMRRLLEGAISGAMGR